MKPPPTFINRLSLQHNVLFTAPQKQITADQKPFQYNCILYLFNSLGTFTMMQFQPVSTWGLNTGTFHPISSLIIHADSSLVSQYGELPQGASETPHLQIFSPSSSSSIPLLSADGDDDGEKRDTNDTARIASGVMHSLLSAFGVSFNLMVLMINWLECRPSRRTGAPTMVNISLLAVCDLLYSLMSAYYAVASFLGDHNFLGVWSCR